MNVPFRNTGGRADIRKGSADRKQEKA
ncbi:hypothetical protein CL3_13180 [butyrate-producing bacterium SM4/1]|nr:hypothetical protein CLS_35810 [[Clostridium] cf. saccharolyticum K10]CBL36051.1 hypothetical protein CL3_13180 [butyrate-producing bacterium SM4/1]